MIIKSCKPGCKKKRIKVSWWTILGICWRKQNSIVMCSKSTLEICRTMDNGKSLRVGKRDKFGMGEIRKLNCLTT